MSGGMRKRTAPFVQIKSETVNNPDVSLRAIGLLAWLLDKPAGWDVRSEAIAKKTKEGREAVRTALHELGAVGHYRIERRRLLDGTFEMGTAVSYEPDPDWAAQYTEYEGKPVTMVQQPDESFKVKRKDGTLVADGFEGDVSAGQTGNGFSGAGEPGAGHPAFGEPDSGDPASGRPSPINRTHSEDTQTETDSSTSDESAGEPEQPSFDGMPDGASSTPAIGKQDIPAAEHAGDPVAQWWWDQLDPKPITTSTRERPFIHIRNICRGALELGWTQRQVADALVAIRKPLPGKGELDQRLRDMRDGTGPIHGGRPASNVHQMDPSHPDVERRRSLLG